MQVKLSENDWMFITQLIYRLNRIDDLSSFCFTFLQQIRVLIPYSESRFYRVRREAGSLHPFSRICVSSEGGLPHKEYDISKYDCFWSEYLYAPWSTVFRHSDTAFGETFEETELYKNVYKPQNIHHAVKTVLILDDKLLGITAFFRPKSEPDFSARDVYILNVLKDHLALKFNQLTGGSSDVEVMHREQKTVSDRIAARYSLTSREHEILGMILGDSGDSDISDILHISPSTLKKHIYNIYQKTNVKNRMQLRRLANTVD